MHIISNIRFFFHHYWKSIVVAIVILYLSTAPGSEFSNIPTFPNEDKMVHFLMYFGFTFALLWDYASRFGLPAMHQKKVPFIVIGLPVLWGGSMELIQAYFTTSRSGDWRDELANTCGAVAGYFIARFIVPVLVKRKG